MGLAIFGMSFWQMREVIAHLKRNLSEKEQSYIIGVNPMNEPIDGGYKTFRVKIGTPKMGPFNRESETSSIQWVGSMLLSSLNPSYFGLPTLRQYQPMNPLITNLLQASFVFNSHYYDALHERF